jgi:hypothetical protein
MRGRRTRTRTLIAATVIGMLAVGLPGPALAADDAADDRVAPLPALGALGANYNENLDEVNYLELREARASWIRGFYVLPEADTVPPEESPTIRSILEAHDRGYRTVLSLKFPKANSPFPAPGSASMAAELDRLDRVLPLVLGTVDVITIGNEPFIESMPDQRDERLNAFYETIARHVIDARAELCGADCATHLYMGALNRLDLPQNRTAAVERFLAFARETPEIEGVDLHPHVPDEARVDPVPTAFAERYGYAPETRVWEVIGEAIERPFPSHKWNDLLSQSPWFEGKKHVLSDVMGQLRSTGRLAVATYGFVQIPSMTSNWSAEKAPWLLNSVYASLTVQTRGDAMSTPTYAWIDDFRSLQ